MKGSAYKILLSVIVGLCFRSVFAAASNPEASDIIIKTTVEGLLCARYHSAKVLRSNPPGTYIYRYLSGVVEKLDNLLDCHSASSAHTELAFKCSPAVGSYLLCLNRERAGLFENISQKSE